MVVAPEFLASLNAEQLRELANDLIAKIANKDRELVYRSTKIDQLTHEIAVLKRWKFGRSREQSDATQASLLDETIDTDIAAIEQELTNLTPPPKIDTERHRASPQTQTCSPTS